MGRKDDDAQGSGAHRESVSETPIASRRLEILLVDDDPFDVRMTSDALRESGLPHRVMVARDGIEAMEALRGAAVPDLVLLDLNLPRKDGREVLAEVRSDPALRRVPIVVLTSSQADEDILRSYDLRANGYLTKPVEPAHVLGLLRGMDPLSAP
jgi:CheY-like chemotaxis protein